MAVNRCPRDGLFEELLRCIKRPIKKIAKCLKRMIREDDCLSDSDSDNETCCSCFCKIIGFLAFVVIVGLCGILLSHLAEMFFGSSTVDTTEPPCFPPRKCKVEIGKKTKEELKAWILKEVQTATKVCSRSGRMTPDQMRVIIREEIRRQQRCNLKPDFASSAAGAMVIAASPTWTAGYPSIYFLFIPIRTTAPSPSIILEPTRQAGECWPMKGSTGRVMIQLAARATVVGFTLEHIHPTMSLSGSTQEAPSNFTVYGILNPDSFGASKHCFGSYFYDNKKDDENQYFRVQNPDRRSFLYIELEINSNHGNDKYTCIYRFQVHGYIDQACHC